MIQIYEPRIYEGVRVHSMKGLLIGRLGTEVTVNGLPLKSHYQGRPEVSSFEWGYVGGSATLNLALSLLDDYFEKDDCPLDIALTFAKDVVSKLDYSSWRLDTDDISDWAFNYFNINEEMADRAKQLELEETEELEEGEGYEEPLYHPRLEF